MKILGTVYPEIIDYFGYNKSLIVLLEYLYLSITIHNWLFAILCGLLKYSCRKLLFHQNNPLKSPFFKGGRGDYCIIIGLNPCL